MTGFTDVTTNYPQGANTAIRRVVAITDPSTSNWQNFIPGDEWWNKIANRYWKMVDNKPHNALWIQLGVTSGSFVATETGNSGGAVAPDGMGNLNVIGDGTTISVVGNPGTNTLEISAITTSLLSELTGNSGGPVSPSGHNINIVGDGTTVDVVGDPATHTLTISVDAGVFNETLTGNTGGAVGPDGSNNISVVGDGTTIDIVGSSGAHTLTASVIAGAYFSEFTPDSGGAVSPDSGGNLNLVGDGVAITTLGDPGTNTITISAISGGIGQTITGNTGGAVAPTSGGNWNLVGDGSVVNVAGNPGTNTLTITAATGSGNLVLLDTQTIINQSSVVFTNITGYNNYGIRFFNLVPVVNSVYLQLQVSTNNGSTYQSTGYYSQGIVLMAGSSGNNTQTNASFFGLTNIANNSAVRITNGATYPSYGFVNLIQLGSTAVTKGISTNVYFGQASLPSFTIQGIVQGIWSSTAVVNAVQISFSAGNIASGTFYLYGVS